MNNSIQLIISTQCVGFHFYPDAPEVVSFLRFSHRHLFKFKVYFKVLGTNREQEFFILQNKVKAWLSQYPKMQDETSDVNFEARSCEQIAQEGLRHLASLGCFAVEVYEDGENGARVERGNN